MFDLSRGVSEAEPTAQNALFIGETTAQARVWLHSNPNAAALVSRLPALELALAQHVTNHDAELLALVKGALERMYSGTALETVDNATLAGLIGLTLRIFLLTSDESYKDAAVRLIAEAQARFDEQDCYFKIRAADTSKRFEARANARLGEVFYFAWRVLDDQTLRPLAGEILGQVSTFFDPSPRFSDTELPVLETSDRERRALGVRAAAMQLFMTAGETTGRRTYLPRAAIVADATLANLKTLPRETAEMAEFASALLRLEQFTGELRYGSAARYLANEAQAEPRIDNANVALARLQADGFPLHMVIVGDVETDPNAKALWFAAMREYAAARVIEVLHPIQHAARIAELGYAVREQAAAHICVGTLCLPAVDSVEGLKQGMQRARQP